MEFGTFRFPTDRLCRPGDAPQSCPTTASETILCPLQPIDFRRSDAVRIGGNAQSTRNPIRIRSASSHLADTRVHGRPTPLCRLRRATNITCPTHGAGPGGTRRGRPDRPRPIHGVGRACFPVPEDCADFRAPPRRIAGTRGPHNHTVSMKSAAISIASSTAYLSTVDLFEP